MAHPDADVYPGQVLSGRWQIGRLIGEGAFSLVYEAIDVLNGDQCAVKILSMTRRSSEALDEFRAEAELLRLLDRCSNVIRLLDSGSHSLSATVASSTFALDVEYLVLEKAALDLAELLLRRHEIDWEARLTLFRQVVKGMHQMHLREIVNRDLKGDNVLVFDEGKTGLAKVSDLGRSKDTKKGPRFQPEDYIRGRGDLRFAPPEMLWGLGNTDAETMRLADLYLLGSILFEIGTGQGLTAIALGNPHAVMKSTAGMSRTDREADFAAHVSDLQPRYELAYALFERDLPSSIRQQALRVLQQLSSVAPSDREPVANHRRGLPVRWDLQWLLRRADIMILTLRTERRRYVKRPWKSPKP